MQNKPSLEHPVGRHIRPLGGEVVLKMLLRLQEHAGNPEATGGAATWVIAYWLTAFRYMAA